MTQGWTGPGPGPARTLPPMGGDLVTGEAVLLELRLAKLPSRAVAEILDLLVMYAAMLLISIIGGFTGLADSLDGAAAIALLLVLVIGIFLGYPVIFETLSRGRTLGKMAMGLRVVREDGGPIQFRHALVRGLLGIFELYATSGVVAIIASLVSSKGKRVGDFAAGTVVVRERVPHVAAPMVQMPPVLAPWAATLELSRLPDDLALSARQFLSRSRDLSPQVRYSMASRLAYDVSLFVAPGPPPGCPPEAYLAAVLAERRRREEQRYTGSAVAASPYAASAPPTYDQRPFQPPPPPGPTATEPPPVDPGSGFTLPS